MKTWIGTSGFQYPEWKGKFYPEDLSAAKMLPYYAGHFDTTEVNYSFRRIPSEQTLVKWDAATPANFRFSFKAPQKITHFARLRNCADTTVFFFEMLRKIDHKLGPVLFQLPPGFAADIGLLKEFLATVPVGARIAFEFRHVSWLDDAVYQALSDANAALCIAESEDFVTPPIVTADFGYLRLRRVDYTKAQLKKWSAFIQGFDGKCAFVYFKHEELCVGPEFARQFQALLK